jgi:hypothetical protein
MLVRKATVLSVLYHLLERAFALMHVFSSRDGFSIDSFEAVDLSGDLIFLKCEKVPLA